MKTFILAALLTITSSFCLAQNRFAITLGTGLGTYKMTDLREYEEQNNSYKTIDDYPAYIYWTGKLSYALKKDFKIGVTYGLYSTGYKEAYSDYSGSVKKEHIIKADNIGVTMEKQFWEQGKFSLSGEVGLQYALTELKRQYILEFYPPASTFDKSTYKYFGNSFLVSLDFPFAYKLTNSINLNASVGYCYDFRSDLITNNTAGLPYLPKRINFSKPCQSDWSGWRLGLSASYNF